MNEIAFIIQARLGSTRLANKILLPFYQEECILDIILKRLTKNFPQNKIIVATTINDHSIVEIAKKYELLVYQGSEDNVLERFVLAAQKFGIKQFFRLCSDNPFFDIDSFKLLLSQAEFLKPEYLGYKINNTPSIKTHYGFWGEYVTIDALKKVQQLTSEKIYIEHVTNFIYENPSLFKINFLDLPSEFSSKYHFLRLTIDTLADFEIGQYIYSQVMKIRENFNMSDVLKVIDSNPQLFEKMKIQISLNSK